MARARNGIEVVKTTLEIDEKLDAHRKGWAVQKVGLTCIFLLIVLAAAGVFGNGVASKTTVTENQVTVQFQRFDRFQHQTEVKISVNDPSAADVVVALPSDYLDNFELTSIQPEPEESRHENGQLYYSFDGTGAVDITLFLTPQHVGTVEGALEVNGRTFHLKHFIYP